MIELNKILSQRCAKTLLLLHAIFFLIGGCELSETVPSPPSGSLALKVRILIRDEFGRIDSAAGPFTVTVRSKDRTIHHIIPDGENTFVVTNVPYQEYIASVNKQGYYLGIGKNYLGNYYGNDDTLDVPIFLYPFPSPNTRIDSINCTVNTVVPQVRFTMYPAQIVPSNVSRYVVLFAGLAPNVSSDFGKYVYTLDYIFQTPGSSTLRTVELYRQLQASGISTGSRVYVTARIQTGATATSLDERTGLTVYSNLENNTTAVSSFIMP